MGRARGAAVSDQPDGCVRRRVEPVLLGVADVFSVEHIGSARPVPARGQQAEAVVAAQGTFLSEQLLTHVRFGETTVGRLLAQRLGVPYADGDDFHPAPNVAKMRAGHPLDDEDRRPWLDEMARWLPAMRTAEAWDLLGAEAELP